MRQGELSASALREVLSKSWLRNPPFFVGLNVSTPNICQKFKRTNIGGKKQKNNIFLSKTVLFEI